MTDGAWKRFIWIDSAIYFFFLPTRTRWFSVVLGCLAAYDFVTNLPVLELRLTVFFFAMIRSLKDNQTSRLKCWIKE
jgi:hypothetical protein